ncbi:YbfB/YjiJ family MFS transporter [Thiopseudomonas acetoxidans]|uniref:YbfB/YjiJ family MFS transporter n=1 Tax=Thiopseudomonas acetoxidans TaxID=3041622 RepID=A0ABT7SQK3_9GAMM|nr:YbfB/YjiJ family MFS transporter [Thiopseudomonas sp. CY1220]MDM7858466.1 YbfB/YjiJ family MFS transporter [Thiopseudomonas sp. CY1220]
MNNNNTPNLLKVIVAGALILLVVHTLGRFIYTPLLPLLIADGALTIKQGADIASWNYLGYLIGALLAMRWHRIEQIRSVLPWALGINVLCTFLQTQTDSFELLSMLRLINGISNGIVFVQAPAFILEWLARHGRASASGLVYLGVGVGLIVSSALVSIPADWLSGSERWWPAFILSVPLAIWGWRQLMRLEVASPITVSSAGIPASSKLLDKNSTPLFLSYAGAGMGYILPMTFLPTLASQLPDIPKSLVGYSWLVVALATLPAPWIWNRAGAMLGDTVALRVNYALQLLGVLAVLVIPGTFGVLLCGLLVGSTFLGTVLLSQRLARTLHPHQGPRLSAALVALYSVTQLGGPWLTKQWLNAGGTLQGAFWLGAGALVWGLFWAFLVPRRS